MAIQLLFVRFVENVRLTRRILSHQNKSFRYKVITSIQILFVQGISDYRFIVGPNKKIKP